MSAPLAYAIDFGTSNSSIAVAYPDRVEVVAVEDNSSLPESLPSIIYLHRSGQRSAGNPAVQQYLVTGAQRTLCSRCELVEVQKGAVYTGCRTYKPSAGCMDARLMSSLKSFLSDPRDVTHSWATDYTFPELIAIIIQSLKRKADAYTGGEVKRVMLGHPVAFEGTEGPGFELRQKAALNNLTRAAELAGFEEVGLFPEPSAAVINESLPSGAVVALDFGGGTFDVAIIEFSGDSGEVTALQGAAIGGERFDSMLFDAKIAPVLGLTNRYPRVGGGTESLPGWFRQGMRSLSGIAGLLSSRDARPTLHSFLNRDGEALQMVDRILYEGHAHALHRALEQAKIQLSAADVARIVLQRSGIDIDVSVTEAEFAQLLQPDMAIIKSCIEKALVQAGKEPEQIGLVIRTGGSSRIRSFTKMLEEIFGAERVVERHLFNTVVTGLASEARREWGSVA